jgi:GC-rich sequence DNA-binding factor
VTPLPTLAPALARLTASLTTLTTSHASSASTLAALAQERAALDAREAELRAGARQSRPRRAWFGAFREWLEGVAAFLDEKYPALEKVEQEHESLVRERAERVAKRRRSDDTDDLAMFLGGAPVAEADEGTDPAHRPERRAARTARHQARAAARASADEEGYSTDGELEPADAADLRAALSALASRADGVLADVHVPEFRDPARGQGLAAWFGAWRAQFEDVYVGAWGGLGALGAWEFWARLELARAGWCPIERGAQELDAFGWFRALHAFARPDGEDGELGPEGDLAAAMVGTAAVPRTVRLLEAGALDPYDAGAVRRAAEFAEQVEALCGREAKYEVRPAPVGETWADRAGQMYIAAVSAVFAREVTAFEARAAPFVRTGGAARFDPGAIPARRRVIARVGKLVRGAVRWRRVAGAVGTLERAVAAALVLAVRLAEGGWDVGGEEGVRKVGCLFLSAVARG